MPWNIFTHLLQSGMKQNYEVSAILGAPHDIHSKKSPGFPVTAVWIEPGSANPWHVHCTFRTPP